MIIEDWHGWVNQPKYDKAWHDNDVADELAELEDAYNWLNYWSELSDVVYTVTRARWSGHDMAYPIKRFEIPLGLIYMFPKYSLRTLFFRAAGKKAGADHIVNCVRNPKKTAKLRVVAKKNGLNPEEFQKICETQLNSWLLLP